MKILKTSSRQEVVLDGRVKSFNTWVREVEAAQEFRRQSWDGDRTDLGQYRRIPKPSLRISAHEQRVLGEYRRVSRPALKISTLERRVLGQYRRVPRPLLRIPTLERRVPRP